MFGIGLSEIILILLILIIFIRPEDLPKFLRSVGRTYGKAKKMYNDIIQVKDRVLKEIDDVASFEEKEASKPEQKTIAGAAETGESSPAEPREKTAEEPGETKVEQP